MRRRQAEQVDTRERRAGEIRESIRQVLIRDWEPIHVKEVPAAQDDLTAPRPTRACP